MTETAVVDPSARPGARVDAVDWNTARRVARYAAGRDPLSDSYLLRTLETDFAAVTTEAEELVSEFTGLVAPGRAQAGVVDRGGWIDANVASMQRLLAPITAKVGARVSQTPLAPIGKHFAGTELGVLLGYMSQRVLGQYDLLVPEPAAADGPPDDGELGNPELGDQVFYVGPNVLALEKRFAFRPLDFRRWIAIHELTHRAQFTGVPWLRGYFLSLVERTLSLVEPDPRILLRAAARAAESLSRGRSPFDDAGLIGLFASDEQRAVLDEMQALMSLLEGHGNYVMNALGARHVHGVERMERVLQQRREAKGISGQFQKALGIQMKMRQYEVGEAFLDAVVEQAGIGAIDAAWAGPENLPTLPELRDASRWLGRVHGATVASSGPRRSRSRSS